MALSPFSRTALDILEHLCQEQFKQTKRTRCDVGAAGSVSAETFCRDVEAQSGKWMPLSYSYRLYPNHEQRQALGRILEIHRQLYNAALQERREAWQRCRVSISYTDQANQLKELREFDEDAAWLNYSSIQQTLCRLDKAFQAFCRRVKAGERPRYPRFKGSGPACRHR